MLIQSHFQDIARLYILQIASKSLEMTGVGLMHLLLRGKLQYPIVGLVIGMCVSVNKLFFTQPLMGFDFSKIAS